MSAPTFDALVLIGRFAPFHDGHREVLDRALASARHVLVVVGSARRPRTAAQPWTASERAAMIDACLAPGDRARVHFGAAVDSLYNEARWVRTVQAEAMRLAQAAGLGPDARIGVIGAEAGRAQDWLSHFGAWPRVSGGRTTPPRSRGLRERFLDAPKDAAARAEIAAAVPAGVAAWLDGFRRTPEFAALVAERAYLREYKAAWKSAPYPPVYVTVDAAVVHSGHILLVQRGRDPGRGLWALPGGFLDQEERIFDACVRELREETRLAVPAEVLRGAVRGQGVFDHPERSQRGRTITHAFLFDFPAGPLPAVEGADDADRARWVPLAEFADTPERMFDDHYDIGMHFLDRI